ncbi:Phospholipid scramblase family protein [Monoraphidium neglectum]|uniref:Phospholipid scramblase n=1 Tax=Monoraphidium neglectum TaxID=145388 RepID=A0A0D2L803_9CHLO|nr:Phospholipid scramblase family protein [Monoraphidium neglectum]KIZ02989.1 Phospholipid scramblase family protein [Monoraphidium neglectum]|eukprot:XP_013902008.1 Phospholipid scramblase family protein [Monoraphidium neglectum]
MQRASRRAANLLLLHCQAAASSTPSATALQSSRGFTTSAAALDAARERRLVAAQERAKRRAAAAAAAAAPSRRAGGAPPPAPLPGGAGAAGTGVLAEVGPLAPAEFDLPNEAALSQALNRPALIITRAIEWGTVILGYEVATKYTVHDEHGNVVALMAEEETGLGNFLARQLLRTRRAFKTTVFSPDGSEVLFKVHRPAYLISSSMTVLDCDDRPIGEVRQRWHPIKRNYDLYLDRRQMAAISGSFLAWEFELKDAAGNTMALIDRNFQGFAKELFTDAGKYVIHFGFKPEKAAEITQTTLEARR